MMSSKPWDIYAKQLLDLGYGHPLWFPEPDSGYREVLVGDVGWLHDGKFNPLFNSTKSPDDEMNTLYGVHRVPRDFSILDPSILRYSRQDRIQQDLICSRSIQAISVTADVGIAP